MGRALAETLGWVAPSERFIKTVERAQMAAYTAGAAEVSAEHLFEAAIVDLDAVYFLARYRIPLDKVEAGTAKATQPKPDVPRLPPPSYAGSKPSPLQPPHLDLPASAHLRRVGSMASALAEQRGYIEVHGGIALEAILEDGRSEAARTLKTHYAEVASGERVPGLPGGLHPGAVVSVAPPLSHRPRPAAPPPPRRTLASALEQAKWLRAEAMRELEQESTYKFIEQLDAFAEKDRPFASIAAMQLREEARADLNANPIFLCYEDLKALQQSAEALDFRVREAALRVAEIKPQVFERFLAALPDTVAPGLRAAAQARAEERASLAEATAEAPVPRPRVPYYEGGTFPFPMREPVAQTATGNSIRYLQQLLPDPDYREEDRVAGNNEASDDEAAPKQLVHRIGQGLRQGFRQKTLSGIFRIWMLAAAAGASMVSIRLLL